ncbi:MAG: carboxymuconolactone decarboxylase family protein [Hyphomicrobiaceae bacterium]
MARLPYIEKSQLPPEHQDLMKRDISLYKQLVHSPGALRAFQGLGYYIRWKSPADARLRELAILQVGWLAQSPYEWSHHVKIGYDFGVTDDDIKAMIAETEGKPSSLDPVAKLVCKGAREMTTEGAMAKSTFEALRQHMSNEHLVDLIVTTGFYNAVVRVLASLEIDVEPEYQKYLDKHPLPNAKY